VNTLPYPDSCFDVALTRYSVHHFIRPQIVLVEMVRVVKPGGRAVIADLVLPASKSLLYDSIERRRDPSHVHVLSEDDLQEQVMRAGLTEITWAGYRFELRLAALMGGSFPGPDDARAVQQAFEADADLDLLGVGLTKRDEQVWLAYPIAVVSGTVE
jgi:SAM-dependent methyltransferase